MRFARLLLLPALLSGPAALAAQDDPSAVFAEANDLFRQANELRSTDPRQAMDLYRRSALRYEHLIGELGLRNSKLYYNLGNAYYQLDDIGRAIVNYRRAERLDPGDANLLRNLEHARAQRQDRFDSDTGGQALRTLLFWHFEFSASTRARIFGGAWFLFWSLLLLRSLGLGWVPQEIAVAAGIAALLVLGSLAYEAVAQRGTALGVIVVPDTVARQGDGHSYESAFREPLHAGAEFRVLEERPDWYRVELPDGSSCWLPAADVELLR